MVAAGRLLATALAEEGVTHAFTVPGESFLGLLQAVPDAGIRLVATRHEAGAGFMAEAFGQLTRRPAACLVTRAVGTANLAIALHTARQDSTPLVAIAGQVPRGFRGREAFQEADLVATFGGLCKEAAEVVRPADLVPTAVRLVRASREGRPGPVLLSVPEDVFDEDCPPAETPARAPADAASAIPEPAPDRGEVNRALDVLLHSRTAVIVAGAGIARIASAREALVRFAEAAGIPVVASWRRPDVFPNDNPLYLGMAGLGAPATVRARLEEADAVLAIGTRLSEITTFGYSVPATTTRLIHVDLEPGFRGDRRPPEVAVRSDAGAFLDAALAELQRRPELVRAAAADERRSRAAHDRAAFIAATTLPAPSARGGAQGIEPATVIRALRARLRPGTVLTTDAGNFAGWAARYLPMPNECRFLGPTSGAMGYALPAAIGASLAQPERPIVALAGDGGFAMLMSELETAVREGARLVAIVFDNRMYGTIRMYQEDAQPPSAVGTNLGAIDFATVAEAMGARGIRLDSDGDVEPGVADALGAAGVTVVHVRVDPTYLSVDRMLRGAPGAGARLGAGGDRR